MAKHLAIIPARAGSKSIQNKNLIRFNGKTLINITLGHAYAANIFSKIIVTSDYPRNKMDIEDFRSTSYTKVQHLRRAAELCQDDTLMIDVIKDVLAQAGGIEHFIWLLQPTSPFRALDDFKKIHAAIETEEYESAISFVPTKDHPSRFCSFKNGIGWPLKYSNFDNKQDLPPMGVRSGHFYVCRRSHIEENKNSKNWTWFIKPWLTYCLGGIDPETSSEREKERARRIGVNIDSQDDLSAAKEAVRLGLVRL